MRKFFTRVKIITRLQTKIRKEVSPLPLSDDVIDRPAIWIKSNQH